jgi:hypothetical protein
MTTWVPLLELGSLQSRPPDLIARKGPPSWSEAVVLTDDIQATGSQRGQVLNYDIFN